MPLVVSDSSTLIHLARIGRFCLLHQLFERITVTPAVWREVVEQGEGRAGAVEVANARDSGWIDVVAPRDMALARLLRRDLGDGESEIITLAIERQAALVLLDESDARRAAEIHGLKKTGVIGVLMRAKQEGAIASLKTELDTLREGAGFWIKDSLYHRALSVVGEE